MIRKLKPILGSQYNPDRFFEDYVKPAKPVFIKGFASDWAKTIDFDSINATDDSIIDSISAEKETVVVKIPTHTGGGAIPLKEFIKLIQETDDYLQSHPIVLRGKSATGGKARSEFQALEPPNVLSRISTAPLKEPILYPNSRTFLHSKNAGTDWHPHPLDDAFPIQVHGEKKFYFIEPKYNKFLTELIISHAKAQKTIDISQPELKKIDIYEADLCPGDALYIPVGWYHATKAVTPGITTIICFSGPKHTCFDFRSEE